MKRDISVILVVLLFVSGCASIVSKSEWPVDVTSNPSGATCTVKNRDGKVIKTAITPAGFMLKSGDGYFKRASYTFSFEKEGYQPASAEMTAGLNGWYWGNIIFGGLIGMLAVDPGTGAMWDLEESVSGTLVAMPDQSATAPAAAPSTPPVEAGIPIPQAETPQAAEPQTAAPQAEAPAIPPQDSGKI